MGNKQRSNGDAQNAGNGVDCCLDQRPGVSASSAELLCNLVDTIREYGVVILDGDGGIKTWNAGAARLTDYSPNEIIGKHFSALFSGDRADVDNPQEDLQRAATMGEFSEQRQCATKAGVRFWAAITITAPTTGAHKPHEYAVVIRDLTEQRRVERTTSLMADLALNALVLVSQRGEIVRVNPQTETLFGYSSRELIGQQVEVLVPEAMQGRHPALRDAFFESPAIRAMGAGRELNGRRKDGSEFPVEIGLNPVETDEGLFVLSAIVDITERKRGEEAIKRLAAIIESSEDAILGKDLNGIVTSWNPGAEKIFGYSSKDMIGQSIAVLIPEGQAEEEQNILARIRRGERVDHYETARRRKDGTIINVSLSVSPILDSNGRVIGASKVARDITERKLADERFRRVVESTPSAMVMVNEQGEIVLVNLQTERLFGYSRGELLGQPIELLVPERSRDKHPVYRHSFFAQPTARPMGVGRDLRGRRHDGSEFPVEIGLTPIEMNEGWMVLSAIVDITERKEAEEKSRLHLAEMAHALRLSTVGEMFSGLAHEINQPLAAAANYARTCVRYARSDDGISKEKLIEWMEKSNDQTARAIEIVKRVGKFVRKEHSKQILLNLNTVIREVLALPGLAVGAVEGTSPVAPQLDFEESLPQVLADRVQIEQVLVNLFRNAIESMADVPVAKRQLIVRTSHGIGNVEVEIVDAGHGIAPDDLAKLFNPFFTTKQDGMGLGLSISRSIIEAHLGRLSAESKVGFGTTFRFSLPTPTAEAKL